MKISALPEMVFVGESLGAEVTLEGLLFVGRVESNLVLPQDYEALLSFEHLATHLASGLAGVRIVSA